MSFKEYKAVKRFYDKKVAERSGVPLIKHIDEGLIILDALKASAITQRAWCLHPMLQPDAALKANLRELTTMTDSLRVVAVAMEYRNKANAWLSDKVRKTPLGIMFDGAPDPGPLLHVKKMLIADKVQNYKDFLTYHDGKHERSDELNAYFERWLTVLGLPGGKKGVQFRGQAHLIDQVKELKK